MGKCKPLVDGGTPQDNDVTQVEPATSLAYSYKLVADHTSGTHWCHAHVHGNTRCRCAAAVA